MIRPATPNDVPEIANLIRELAEYEKLSHEITFDINDLREHLFGVRPYAEVLIAEHSESRAIVGFAFFFHNYSTFCGKPGIYLEDLFVRPQHRGQGYGKALLARLAQLAIDRSCARLDWAVLDWNKPSIGFYERLGAQPQTDWTTYRLVDEPLEKVARSDNMKR
ncbi:MAG: GNAT family N-acetyltransferase [Anaerolineae bacterium]|nr:GNAT family N-acetyltransferase [Phycisphaerae bacterium]